MCSRCTALEAENDQLRERVLGLQEGARRLLAAYLEKREAQNRKGSRKPADIGEGLVDVAGGHGRLDKGQVLVYAADAGARKRAPVGVDPLEGVNNEQALLHGAQL